MKKKIYVYVIIFATITIFATGAYISHSEDYLNDISESTEELYKDFLLSRLSSYMIDAINNYYNESRQFDLFDAKVLNIERLRKGSFYFKITIQVVTFIGPHNPPYGIETITILQDTKGIRVIDFKHEEYKKSR